MQVREAGKPSLLRAINLRAIFDLVHADGPVGAPQVVRRSGLSRPTVADVISQLLDLELIEKVGRTSGSPGPTAQLYDVNPRAGWVLSIDVGREWCRAALSDLGGTRVARAASPTAPSSTAALIAQLRQLADRLTSEAGITLSHVDQIVMGIPGVIGQGEDHLSLAPNFPGLEAPSAISDIQAALVSPIVFENDVNLAAVGEHVQGVARGVDDFVLISVGNGVGMGVILDGGLRHGATGLAGEIGYLALDMAGDIDLDGTRPGPVWGAGKFEALVSADGVLAQARDAGLADVRRAVDVFDAARAGDQLARRLVDLEARRLAHAIAAVAAVLDPGLVVLGGGIGTGAGDLLLPAIAEALPAISPFSPRLAISALGADAVIAGASAIGLRLAMDCIFERAASNLPSAAAGR